MSCLIFVFSKVQAQSTGTILIISNADATAVLDGSDLGQLTASKPSKFELSSGEHYLQIIPTNGADEKNEILTIEADKQKVLKYEFESSNTSNSSVSANKVLVAELDVTIPGITSQTADDYQPPYQLYAFEEGDEIVIDLEMYNLKGTNTIEIISYPSGNSVYSKNAFQNLSELRIKVIERSIYGIVFSSNFIFDRTAKLTVSRIPESEATAKFNPSVSWQTSYRAEVVQKPQDFYINSGSNRALLGGKSRITIPVKLPQNTVKWYYEFSASREEEDVNNVLGTLDLAGEISGLIDKTGLIQFGIELLNKPPGADFCDIYLIDDDSYSLFLNRGKFLQYPVGTRENIKSGIVEIESTFSKPIYLGLKNPSTGYGLHIVVEIVAIVAEEGYAMDHVD